VRIGAWIFGVLAGILLLYLAVGLALPGRWEAEQSGLLPAPPSEVYPFLADLDAWGAWTPFPDSGLESFGPPSGAGAGIRWDDERYGSGEARITSAELNRHVEYQVLIEGGSLTIQGTISLEPEGDGTRIRWREEGDFGWNPLMGYAARGMSGSQGEAMRASLRRLAEAVEAGPAGSSPDGAVRDEGAPTAP